MVPSTNASVVAKAVPPVTAAYHCKLVPVAVKLAIVALPAYTCGEMAVGAVGAVFTVIATEVRVLSQPFALTVAT